MKRILFLACIIIGLALVLALLTWPTQDVQALPEYSAQTGEPCATCHISPSGGGSRTPRGQAWIAAQKPGAVPDLIASLDFLGVSLDYDPADFTEVSPENPAAHPLRVRSGQGEKLHDHLSGYSGN